MTNIDAFILIGGRSTRFGADKAFVEFEGKTLAARAAHVARVALPGGHVRFVVASQDQFGSSLTELDGEIVHDLRPGLGPWSGLHAALANSLAEWTLVMACDMPFVTKSLLQVLAAAASDEIDAVVPRQPDGRLQPLCAIYRTRVARATVESFIDGDEHLPPLQSLFDQLKTIVIAPDDDAMRNVNFPADLA